jgi:hypothetical protein
MWTLKINILKNRESVNGPVQIRKIKGQKKFFNAIKIDFESFCLRVIVSKNHPYWNLESGQFFADSLHKNRIPGKFSLQTNVSNHLKITKKVSLKV